MLPYTDIKKLCDNKRLLDSWIRENISKDMDHIIEINNDSISEKVENWFKRQVDDEKIIKLCDAGINPLDRIPLSDFKADSYDDLKKYYIALLVQNINEYIYEARDRKKIYEQSY